ncbi:hypothetical protein AGMMS50249_4570 [candidate division SR1 bacterium]|nr:hypothetical protein AGMMS50249_4570 [candidate division SR1 bacterium]
MKTALFILVFVLGLVIVTSILMMNPKDGGIGMGIGGAAAGGGGNEYGSKKTMEGKIKKVALIASILLMLVCLFLPFVK